MPRKSASTTASDGASTGHTTHDLAKTLLSQSPSKESLDVVAMIYANYLNDASDDDRTLKCLEELEAMNFLQDALWPLADVVATMRDCCHVKKAWLVTVLLLVGFRAREGDATSSVDACNGVWKFLKDGEAAWRTFMTTLWTVLEDANSAMEDDAKWTLKEQTALTHFLITCFQSLQVPQVASSVLQMTSLSLWTALSSTQRALEFQTYPKLERHWHRIRPENGLETDKKKPSKKKKRRKVEPTPATPRQEQMALLHRIDAFLHVLKAPVDDNVPKQEVVSRLRFIASFIALLVDLLSQLPTRRFLLTVLRRRHIRTVLGNSMLLQHALQWQSANDRQALRKQLALLAAYMKFPVDAHTGKTLSPREHREYQDRHIQTLQQCAFQSFRDSRVEELAIASCSHIANASSFAEMLSSILAADRSRLLSLAIAVGVLADEAEADRTSDAELIEFFKEEYSVDASNEQSPLSSNVPVYPTELAIWDEMLSQKGTFGQQVKAAADDKEPIQAADQEPSAIYSADDTNLFPVLPVRKLGLQYLNLGDYLQRNYELLQLEAAQEIRKDLEAAIKELDAVRALRSSSENDTIFRGFAPSSVPLTSALQIVKVNKPLLGQAAPASVIVKLEVELSSCHERKRFDYYQTKEVAFLVAIRATADEGYEMMGFPKQAPKVEGSFPENFGVHYVRAAEIVEVTDAAGNAIDDENPMGKGSKRMFTLALDGVQYKNDLEAGLLKAYEQVNLLVRRDPRDNNFKAVLDALLGTWHDANKEELLPAWLHDLFLGYGDPAAALYQSIYKARAEKQLVVPMYELLRDGEHAVEAGGADKLVNVDDETKELKALDAAAPFTYVEDVRDGAKRIRASQREVIAESSSVDTSVRLTKAQVAAVRTGMCEGLTLIVGPPGTGKTEVAVQLVLNLYRSTPPREKLLVVAHSTQALNDFVARILARNIIREADMVWMGQPQRADAKSSSGTKDEGAFHAAFSRDGRVAFLLERRTILLAEVEQMAQWLLKRDPAQYAGLGGGSASYSCENALVFYQFHMKKLLDAAREATKNDEGVALAEFFTLRKGGPPGKVEDLRQFTVDIESYFTELRHLQPFELLQTPQQRGDMYLIHYARIVVMTCTHAALHYNKLTNLGLRFSSLIMDEAAQASELDTLVPLLLACSKQDRSTTVGSTTWSGLQRLVLMGDAMQLPPMAKSPALKNYAHFNQSLFTRFLCLGVPRIVLDRQGHSRSELAEIYRWRYDDIFSNDDKSSVNDLRCVKTELEYQTSNVGFLHVAQFVDVSNTCKERQLRPFAYENEEEARFVVALLQYMVSIGYRVDQVVVLTPYDAQKELIERLLQAAGPEVKTCQVSTVDCYQDKQKDFVLLSTVRSETSVGHLRDVRRATSGFSRARLGLYVIGCFNTLEQEANLRPFLSNLVSIAKKHDSDKATKLALVPSERVGVLKTKSTAKPKVVYISERKQLEKLVETLKA